MVSLLLTGVHGDCRARSSWSFLSPQADIKVIFEALIYPRMPEKLPKASQWVALNKYVLLASLKKSTNSTPRGHGEG
jgi:hypothetical protein